MGDVFDMVPSMTIRLTDLTPLQIRAMAKLDDGLGHLDSVGREVDLLPDDLLIACYELAVLGLVEASAGWQGTTWFRLTAAGRHVRENESG